MRSYDVVAAVQDSRNRVQSVLTTEIPHLVSARESSSNQESNTSGVASSDKTVTDTHQIRWSAKFDQINKALYDEERDLVGTCLLPLSQNDYRRCFVRLEAVFDVMILYGFEISRNIR